MISYIKWSKEFAYYLGIIWADGHVERTRVILEIMRDDAEEILNDIRSIDFLKINTYFRNRKNRKPQMAIYFCDVDFYDDFLSKYDYDKKSLKNPQKILEVMPENFRRYFILGLIDGDGCFYISKDKKTKQFYITSNYDQDWGYVINLFNIIGIEMYEIRRMINKRGNKSSYIRIKKYSEIEKLFKYLYPNGYEIGLSRKHKKCLDIIKNPPTKSINKSKLDIYEISEYIKRGYKVLEIADIKKCNWRKIYEFVKKNKIEYGSGFFGGLCNK